MENIDLKTIGNRSVHGVIALISRTFVINVVSFIASLVIFTVLSPSEVGVYTAVLAIQRVVSFFTDVGLAAALVQKREKIEENDLTTSFTIQFFITGLIFVLIWLANAPIAAFFHLGMSALALLNVLVFSIFLSSFKTIPSVLLERNIHFNRLIIPQIVESLTFNIIVVILVLKGFGINSFSFGFLISSVIGVPIYHLISPWKIKIGISRESLKHLSYGVQFQAKNILAAIKDDLLTVFLAKTLPFAQLGYIGFAQRLAFFVFRYIVDSVTKVTFSTYARIQDEKVYLKKTIEKSLFFVSMTTFPIFIGIIITAPYIIFYFPKWHNKWEPALLSLTFFCLNAFISSLSGVLVNVLDATGKVTTTLKLMILWTTLTWILTPILIYLYGYNGVSIASFLVTTTIVFTIHLVKQTVEFNFLQSIYKPLIATIIMGIIVYISAKVFVQDLITLAFVILLGGCVYLGFLFILAKDDIKKDIGRVFLAYGKT